MDLFGSASNKLQLQVEGSWGSVPTGCILDFEGLMLILLGAIMMTLPENMRALILPGRGICPGDFSLRAIRFAVSYSRQGVSGGARELVPV